MMGSMARTDVRRKNESHWTKVSAAFSKFADPFDYFVELPIRRLHDWTLHAGDPSASAAASTTATTVVILRTISDLSRSTAGPCRAD